MSATKEFQERIGRIEGLVQKLETAADPILRRNAKELMESLMELHGAGLDRILELAVETGNQEFIQSMAEDPLVSSLLVLYGLHPDDFETRVRRGLEKARPILRSHGARVDVLSISEVMVHVKIVGAGATDLEPIIKEALFETAPDISQVMIDGGKPVTQGSGFVPLSSIRAAESESSPVLAQPLT